jgi:pilin
MVKTLVILILAVVVLSWNFVFTDSKQVEYTDPAKVLQSLSKAIKYKNAVYAFWKEKNVLPDLEIWNKEGKQVDVDISQSLVNSINVGEDGPGVITVYFTNKETIPLEKDIEGKKIILVPKVNGERLIWSCKGTMYQEYMPKKCQVETEVQNSIKIETNEN